MSKKKMPEPPRLPLDYETKCEIALTPDQQRIVFNQTGREMKVLVLKDEDGSLTRNMPDASPDAFTVMAIHQAERLNEYDEDYHQYIKDLAEYQDSLDDPDEMEELAESMSVAAQQEAERLRLFYEKEIEACQNAREIAKIEYGRKETQS